MNITIFDSWNGKFSKDFVDHWKSLGHDVRFNPKWEEAIGADLNFFYQADNGAIEGTKNHKLTGKTFVQCVDIEVWAGQPYAVDWTKVDGVLFMARHIKDEVESHIQFPQNVRKIIIKPGIDTAKWTLKPERDPKSPIKKLAYVVGDGRIWDVKRLDIAFQVLYDLLRAKDGWLYQLHVRGTYSSHVQYNSYCRYLEKALGISDFVIWYESRVEDLNKWLDDKDFFILPSTKEAFSYATAEAMCKGIKPIINNWESSKETWGKYVCNSPCEMAERIIEKENKPEEYRQYILDNFSQERYFKEIDAFMLGGEANG